MLSSGRLPASQLAPCTCSCVFVCVCATYLYAHMCACVCTHVKCAQKQTCAHALVAGAFFGGLHVCVCVLVLACAPHPSRLKCVQVLACMFEGARTRACVCVVCAQVLACAPHHTRPLACGAATLCALAISDADRRAHVCSPGGPFHPLCCGPKRTAHGARRPK